MTGRNRFSCIVPENCLALVGVPCMSRILYTRQMSCCSIRLFQWAVPNHILDIYHIDVEFCEHPAPHNAPYNQSESLLPVAMSQQMTLDIYQAGGWDDQHECLSFQETGTDIC